MATVTISQGETYNLIIPFVDSYGNPISLIDSTLSSLRAYFLLKGTVVYKFTDPLIEPLTNYGELSIINDYTISFNITQEVSKSLPVGYIDINLGYINMDGSFEVVYPLALKVEKGYVLKDEIY